MKRTKLGQSFYNFTMKVSKFLGKHLWLYYILNYTWGIIMTLIGWIVILFCAIFLNSKIQKHGPAYYVMIGDNWGGLELGKSFLVADNMGDSWTKHTKNHELGHTFQNAIYGPFVIFLVAIPSMCRYWYDRLEKKHASERGSNWYDSAWFEGSATDMGNWFIKENENNR